MNSILATAIMIIATSGNGTPPSRFEQTIPQYAPIVAYPQPWTNSLYNPPVHPMQPYLYYPLPYQYSPYRYNIWIH